jgi:hypothetical protein
MKRRWVLALVIPVLGASVAGGAMLAIGGGQDPPKREARNALRPDEVRKLPEGQSTTALALPYEFGRFRITSPDAPYEYCEDTSGATRVRQVTRFLPRPDQPRPADVSSGPEGDFVIVDSVDQLKDHALFVQPRYVPKGWTLASAEALTIHWSDGRVEDASLLLNYEQPGHFYLSVRRYTVPDGCMLQVPDVGRVPASQHALTLSDLDGVPAVIQHQAPGEKIQATLKVTFIQDNVVTEVESVAIDLDELISVARSIAKEG